MRMMDDGNEGRPRLGDNNCLVVVPTGDPVLVHHGQAPDPAPEAPHGRLQTQDTARKRKVGDFWRIFVLFFIHHFLFL